jgi:hypothetical protein
LLSLQRNQSVKLKDKFMGFFSWITQDTDRSIANSYSNQPTFRVVMTDNKGNKWIEEDYEGYGIFGGKDYYELLAEMNGFGSDRDKGITLAFSGDTSIMFPSVSESGKYFNGEKPEDCEFQGYFYSNEEDEDEEDEEDEEDFY